VDVQAEILDLKLRMADLEATLRAGDEDGACVGPCRHLDILTEMYVRVEEMQAKIDRTSLGITGLKGAVTDVHAELSQEFAALGVEIVGIRTQTNDHYAATRAEMLRRFDALRCEMMELGLRLDQFLDQGGA
jgi:hypothetical protein